MRLITSAAIIVLAATGCCANSPDPGNTAGAGGIGGTGGTGGIGGVGGGAGEGGAG